MGSGHGRLNALIRFQKLDGLASRELPPLPFSKAYSAQLGTVAWRGTPSRIGCASIGCSFGVDLQDRLPIDKELEQRLFVHIASCCHDDLVDGISFLVKVQPATPDKTSWIVTCMSKSATTYAGCDEYVHQGTYTDVKARANAHVRQHIIARNSPSYVNFGSMLLRKYREWYPALSESRSPTKPIPVQEVTVPVGFQLVDVGLDKSVAKMWIAKGCDWPSYLRIDYVVVYPNTIHLIAEDEDQHMGYNKLAEWTRPHVIRKAFLDWIKEGKAHQ